MKVETLQQVNKEQARELWQKYQTHRHYQTPADAEIAAIYKRIAQGKTRAECGRVAEVGHCARGHAPGVLAYGRR